MTRSRISGSSTSRLRGATDGATVLRWMLWRGSSIAMKLSSWHFLGRLFADRDAAFFRRIDLVIGVDFLDVRVPRHRPVRTVEAVLAVVHRIFAAQAGEIRPPAVVAVQFGAADVDVGERGRPGIGGSLSCPGWLGSS